MYNITSKLYMLIIILLQSCACCDCNKTTEKELAAGCVKQNENSGGETLSNSSYNSVGLSNESKLIGDKDNLVSIN